MSQPVPQEPQTDLFAQDSGPGLLMALWRYRWLVAITTLLAGGLGFAASNLQTTVYEAQARLLLADPQAASAFGEGTGLVVGGGDRYVRNQAEYVASTPVMLRASELLEGEMTPGMLASRTMVRPAQDVDLINIRVLAPTAQLAADAANAVGQAYQDVRAQEILAKADARIAELEQSRDDVRGRLDAAEAILDEDPDNATATAERNAMAAQLVTLDNRINQLSTDASLYGSGVELFEEARPPSGPAQPQPARNAAVAALLGLLAVSAFSWWRAERTMNADQPGDAAPVLRAPLLGEVPEFSDVGIRDITPAHSAPHSPAGEAYQFILATLEALERDARATSIIVTSAGVGDGKTVTALNLAIAAARDGRDVLLVDADGRARGLTQLAEVVPEPGLTDLGDPELPLAGCLAEWRLSDDLIVRIVPAGKELRDPAAAYRSVAFRRGVQRLADAAELVLVDTPPLLAVSDTTAIASQFDAMLLIVNRGTSLHVLQELRQRLDLLGMPVLGYVFNRARPNRLGRYSYSYHSAHGAGPRAESGNGALATAQGLRRLVRRGGR